MKKNKILTNIQCSMHKYIFLAILILFASGVLYADDIGYKYYKKGNYAKALEFWEKEALIGEKEAYYNIGLLYFFGQGVEKDLSLAFNYCKKAAIAGSARAQNNLSYMYLKGLGVEVNYIEAYAWSIIAMKNDYDSSGLNTESSKHLTPAMFHEAEKLVKKYERNKYE